MWHWLPPSPTTCLYGSELWGVRTVPSSSPPPYITNLGSHSDRCPIPPYWEKEWVGTLSNLSGQWNKGRSRKGTKMRRKPWETGRGEQREKGVLCTVTSSASSSQHPSLSPWVLGLRARSVRSKGLSGEWGFCLHVSFLCFWNIIRGKKRKQGPKLAFISLPILTASISCASVCVLTASLTGT